MEELKLVLETVQALANSGESIAVWWLVLHYGVKVLWIIGSTAFGICAAYFVTKAIRCVSECAGVCYKLAAILDVPGFDPDYSSKRELLIQKVIALKNAK